MGGYEGEAGGEGGRAGGVANSSMEDYRVAGAEREAGDAIGFYNEGAELTSSLEDSVEAQRAADSGGGGGGGGEGGGEGEGEVAARADAPPRHDRV